MMRPVSKADAKILDKIFNGLAEDQSKKINNSTTFMYLSAEHLSKHLFSMAHYYESNGDLCPDPDMELLQDDKGNWYPIAIQQSPGIYTRAIDDYNEFGVPMRWYPNKYNELKSFLSMWLKNLKEQQGL